MAGIKRHYTSFNQVIADKAFSNELFRESDYEKAKETGTDIDYLMAMANTRDNLDKSFDKNVYDRLSDDDRFNYFLHKNYGEKGTENYDKTEEYFNNQIEQIKRQEIYNSLSGFEKAVNSIGGFVGNAVLQLGGIVEGVVDAGTLLVGAAASIFDKEAGQDIKEFISKDATGYGAAQQAMNDYINTYTFIDKNGVTKVINDVTTGIVRMTPMIVGNLLTPVTGGVSSVIGNTIYYASMAGNTAEETIKANPDINYGSLLAYTGASVVLEALTEWASGKIFGDDIVSAMLKGEKYAPTGSIFKNIVKNFTTEGLEEATTELFGSILYNTIVDPKADIASFGDIMYAALIGGLTGAIMSGGQVLTTKKMSVMDGKLVDTSSLTKEQRKTAKNLTKAQSYGLNNLIYQAQQATQQTDEVTKLMSKYGLSLQDVQTEHAEEYQEALEKDTETKTQQAKGILELANLMNTIGVEQFQRSSKLLNEQIEEARTMVNNYLNHSAEYNKAASDAYSAAFDGQSMSPTAQLTNSEQTLVKTLREVYPNLKVAFGTFGSKEGLSVRSIAGTKGWLFIESGLVDKMGYQALLEHAIKNEMTNSMITELEKLPAELSNSLVRIVTEDKTSFKDLSEAQKQTIAQIVCFDPVNNRRIFRNNNKVHSEIFKYITDQANFIKNYARKNDANTLRYRELLKIRNTFLNSIAQTINNAEDVEFVTNEYKLAQDEVKTKIIDKTSPSILNINRKLTSVNLAKDAILREEAISELLDARNKLDKTNEFDYRRLYDESYYADKDWVNSIKTQQQTNDFETALTQHLVAVYKTSFDDRTNVVNILKNNLTEQDVRNAAKELLTKEFNTNVTDYNVLQNEVVNTLYDMLTTEIDDNTDHIVVEDNTIKGGGKIKPFININLFSDKSFKGTSGGVLDARNNLIPPDIYSQVKNTKVRNDRGILPVYHGSYETFDTFDIKYVDIGGGREYGPGFYFSPSIKQSTSHGTPVKYYVNIERPANLTRVTIDSTDLSNFVQSKFETDFNDVMEDLSKVTNDNEVYSTIMNRAYTKGLLTNNFLEDMVSALGVDGTITKPLANGEINYIAYTNKQIIKAPESNIQLFAEQIDNDTKNIKQNSNATSPKQIAEGIASLVANSPIAYSESKGFEGAEMEYTKVAQSMIDENFSLFRKVTQKNYQQIRDEIANTNLPYTEQALLIFDRALFTYAEDSSRFDAETQEKIKNQARQKQTISAQWQGLQSRRFADKTSLTEVKNQFAEQGIDVSVSDDMVAKYVPEIKNKKEFVEQIDKNISELEQKIETANDDLEKAALNKQLKDETDKRIVIEKGTNEEILDWAITNEDIVSRASKIQRDVFEQMVETAELAEKTEGKKALTILVDEKTGLPKPFPKTTQYVQKAVKGLKSFRMWAMLTSPVSWVRNWVGNAGMTALDKATNQFEKFLTNRQPKVDIANLEKQQKALQNKKDLSPTEQAKLAELNAQITRAYDFKFVETTASKDLKKQISEDYKTVFQQILNGEDVSKYEGSAEKAGAIARAERDITRKSENANFVQKVWAACQSMTDWGLNTGLFGDNAVVLNSLVRNFANMVESNKPYLIKSLTTEYGKDGAGMSDARRALVEKALKSKDSMDIINAMSKADVELFMDSCKQRTFEQYFKNSNWLSKWASNLSQKHPIAASLTSLVLPFPKVAANVLTMAYKYSPLGFISALRQWSVVKQMDAEGYKGYRDAFARAKLNRTTSQATVGTIMCIAGLILASLGVIDIEEDDYMGPSLHIGDLRISLSDLAPSMTTLSVGAGMMWAWKNDKSAVLTALDVLYDNTLLGNIENVFKYGSPDKYIENLSINYVSQYVPAMLKLASKVFTNQEMIDKSGTYFEKLWKTFGSGIPGIAHVLPKRVNPYTGEFLTSTGSQNVFFNFIEALSPLDFETTVKSPTQKEAERLNTKTTGLSGTFKVNDTEYVVDKVTYSKYRADYIQTNFEQILSGKQKVTVEDDNGKRITTTYDKLNDKQKKNVIDRLYTEATNITKIKWWTDLGNKYVVTNEDQYKQYRKLFDTRNIVYKETWNKSKFMER